MECIGELAITSGPAVCREGCELHAEWLHIDIADPRVRISAQLLEELFLLGSGPCVDLRPGPGSLQLPRGVVALRDYARRHMAGWVLTVRGVNRTVIYRITEQVPDALAWYAEWPD